MSEGSLFLMDNSTYQPLHLFQSFAKDIVRDQSTFIYGFSTQLRVFEYSSLHWVHFCCEGHSTCNEWNDFYGQEN